MFEKEKCKEENTPSIFVALFSFCPDVDINWRLTKRQVPQESLTLEARLKDMGRAHVICRLSSKLKDMGRAHIFFCFIWKICSRNISQIEIYLLSSLYDWW